jgi:hypothetical protein
MNVAAATDRRSGTSVRWLVELLDVIGSKPLGSRLRQCPHPGHGGDSHPSLSITERVGGGARLHCFAGCPERDVVRSLGLGLRQLYQPPAVSPRRFASLARLRMEFPPVALRAGHPATRGYRLEAVHTYEPAGGVDDRVRCHRLLRWRHRASGAKELMWETRLADGTTTPGLLGTPERTLPLYREREIRMAIAARETILVIESESSVDALTGWYATTWAGGANDVNTDRLLAVLGGYPNIVHIPDFDVAGLACLWRILEAGLRLAVLLGEPGEDARDLHRRLGSDAFRDAVADAARRSSDSAPARAPRRPRPWPVPPAAGGRG